MKPTLIIFGPMILGLAFECLRLSKNPKKFLKALLVALLLSLGVFLPAKKEMDYHLDARIILWPIFFFFGLIIGVTNYFKDLLQQPLNEGTTLVCTITFLYFLAEICRIAGGSALLWPVIPPVLFTFLCAFTANDLKRNVRLVLSIWNTVINLVFGIFLVISVVGLTGYNPTIQGSIKPWDLFLFSLEYAMLGAASIHILYNLYLLIGYLPRKKEFFNKKYFREATKLTEEHIGRYSTVQIKPTHALFVVLLHGGPLMLNYFFHFAAPLFLFWYSLAVSPVIVNSFLKLISRHNSPQHPLLKQEGSRD